MIYSFTLWKSFFVLKMYFCEDQISKMRNKILFISSWFPNKLETTNGNFVRRHAEAVALLHDVEILHAIGDSKQKQNYIFDDQLVSGIRTLIVYYKQLNNPVLNFIRRSIAYQKGFVRLHKPDLVHGNILQNNMLFAVWLNVRYQIPFVISEHWSGFLKVNQPKLSKIALITARCIAHFAKVIFPVSAQLKEDLQSLKIGNLYKVVGNVVDTCIFVPQGKANHHFQFLHISNLSALKNPERIIEAIAKIHEEFPDVELEIGGDGDVEILNQKVQELNAQSYIRTFGEISIQEVASKMAKSQCFVLFSKYETFSCVLLESLSSGTPIISTNVGIATELKNLNCGIIINENQNELYDAMKEMILQYHRFAASSVLHTYVADHYSKRKIAEKFDEEYQKVLAKKEKIHF